MIEQTTLAYLAGIIDGEGCIGAYNTRSKTDTRSMSYQVCVRVCMKTPAVVKLLYNTFGGCIVVQKSKGPGKPGPYFSWQARELLAEKVLKQLLPYLVEKDDQAKLALTFCDIRRGQRKGLPKGTKMPDHYLKVRTDIINELKAMKRKNYDNSMGLILN